MSRGKKGVGGTKEKQGEENHRIASMKKKKQLVRRQSAKRQTRKAKGRGR